VDAAPAVLVHVFGDVDEVREIAERANDVERLRDGKIAEQRDELLPYCWRIAIHRPPEAHGGLANGLNARVPRVAGLRAQHVAQESTQEPRVLAQR